jgi:hypothetical protein
VREGRGLTVFPRHVELRVVAQPFWAVLDVGDGVDDDREEGVENVVHLEEDGVPDGLPLPAREKAVPPLRHDHDEVLVEVVKNQVRVPAVVFSPVVQDQLSEHFKLADGVVGGFCGLAAFQAFDPDPDVSLRDHRNVVRAVADGQRRQAFVLKRHGGKGKYRLAHHLDDHRLLRGRNAARDDHAADLSELDKLARFRLVILDLDERLAGDDHGQVFRGGAGDLPVLALAQNLLHVGVVELIQLLVDPHFPELSYALVTSRTLIVLAVNQQLGEVRCEHLRGEADVDRCLDLVAGEDPELDAGLLEVADRGADLVLQLVLDRGGADQLAVLLDLRLQLLHFLLAVNRGLFRDFISLCPILVHVRGDQPPAEDERPQPDARIRVQGVLRLGRGLAEI